MTDARVQNSGLDTGRHESIIARCDSYLNRTTQVLFLGRNGQQATKKNSSSTQHLTEPSNTRGESLHPNKKNMRPPPGQFMTCHLHHGGGYAHYLMRERHPQTPSYLDQGDLDPRSVPCMLPARLQHCPCW